jgi:hypothetical protein
VRDPLKGSFTVPPWKPDSPAAQDQFRVVEHVRRQEPILTFFFSVFVIAVLCGIGYGVLLALGKV